jgi:hypothetical protein
VLPDEAQPLQGSQLLTALSAGAAIIQLRRVARQLDLSVALDDALGALAQGRGAIAMAQSASLDRVLAAHADLRPFDRRLLGREAYPRVIGGADPAFRLLRRRNARVRFIENKLFGVYVAPMQMPQGGGCLIPAW